MTLVALDRSILPLLRWLRWALVVSLALALPVCARWLELPVDLRVALPALGLLAAHAALGPRLLGDPKPGVVAAGVALDIAGVAAVLWASGGAANPLSALLFVHVALAAALLPAKLALVVAGLSTLGFGALFVAPDSSCPVHQAGPAFRMHLYGMWGAFGVGSALVAYFVSRVRSALAARDHELGELRREAEKFTALGTLAAGAAHELGTPLGTIDVLAGELASGAVDPATTAITLHEQVERCRAVLRRMRPGAERSPRGASELARELPRVVEAWRAAHPDVRVDVTLSSLSAPGRVPLDAADLEAALSVLLDNALDAAGAGAEIEVDARQEAGGPVVRVRDRGRGVPAELAPRLGEPFVTTKQPGHGMGLGLYLVRSVLESVGGRLDVTPAAGGGTVAALRFSSAEV